MDPAPERVAGIAFGRFQVLPDRRDVLADSRPIKLGGRAFDVLMALIEARGAVVSKDALMARVWPGRIIEENSLASQIAALRAAFGAERGLIRTVSGRGYQFTGEIRILPASPNKAGERVATADQAPVLPPINAPKPVSDLIGRDTEVEEVLRLAGAYRLVTLTGPERPRAAAAILPAAIDVHYSAGETNSRPLRSSSRLTRAPTVASRNLTSK